MDVHGGLSEEEDRAEGVTAQITTTAVSWALNSLQAPC